MKQLEAATPVLVPSEVFDPVLADLSAAQKVHLLLGGFSDTESLVSLLTEIQDDYGDGEHVQRVVAHHLQRLQSVMAQTIDTSKNIIPPTIAELIRRYLYQVPHGSAVYKNRFQDVEQITGAKSAQIGSIYAWIRYRVGRWEAAFSDYESPVVSRKEIIQAWELFRKTPSAGASEKVARIMKTTEMTKPPEEVQIAGPVSTVFEIPLADTPLLEIGEAANTEHFIPEAMDIVDVPAVPTVPDTASKYGGYTPQQISKQQESDVSREFDKWFNQSTPETGDLLTFAGDVYRDHGLNIGSLRAILGRTGKLRPKLFDMVAGFSENDIPEMETLPATVPVSIPVVKPQQAIRHSSTHAGETRTYDELIKSEWRREIREFIAARTTPEERAQMRVICLPGREGLEILEIYLPLGFRPENIVGFEKADNPETEAIFRETAARLGFVPHIGRLEDADYLEYEPFDIVSLDFVGPYSADIAVWIRRLPVRERFFMFTNYLGKRDKKTDTRISMMRKISFGTPITKEDYDIGIFGATITQAGKLTQTLEEQLQAPPENNRARETSFLYDVSNIGLERNQNAFLSKGKLRAAKVLRQRWYLQASEFFEKPYLRMTRGILIGCASEFGKILGVELGKHFAEQLEKRRHDPMVVNGMTQMIQSIDNDHPEIQTIPGWKKPETPDEAFQLVADSIPFGTNRSLMHALQTKVFCQRGIATYEGLRYQNQKGSPFLSDFVEFSPIEKPNDRSNAILRVYLACLEDCLTIMWPRLDIFNSLMTQEAAGHIGETLLNDCSDDEIMELMKEFSPTMYGNTDSPEHWEQMKAVISAIRKEKGASDMWNITKLEAQAREATEKLYGKWFQESYVGGSTSILTPIAMMTWFQKIFERYLSELHFKNKAGKIQIYRGNRMITDIKLDALLFGIGETSSELGTEKVGLNSLIMEGETLPERRNIRLPDEKQ